MPVRLAQDINDRSHTHRVCPAASHFSDPLECGESRITYRERKRERPSFSTTNLAGVVI
jgi:hypothetical protein